MKKYFIAQNLRTGLFYSMSLGCAFIGRLEQATLLDSRQAALIRYCYSNTVLVEVQ